MTRNQLQRSAYTLIELLIVIGIKLVLVGLLFPAVMQMWESAQLARCRNNIKELGLACHTANTLHGRLPPGIGYYPNRQAGAYGTGMFHLLPFIGKQNLYKQADGPLLFGAWNKKIYAQKVPIFLCPSDPSANGGMVKTENGTPWGAGGYAGNVQVFAKSKNNGDITTTQGDTILNSIRDGQSNTILFAEHYARCSNEEWGLGGNLWAYWESDVLRPWYPGFAIPWTGESVGFGSKFQHRPWINDCDPTKASTGHFSGMQIGLCDGSVRSLSPSVSGVTWWAMCTPRNGD